jgi:hypothetical protein
MVDEKSKVIDSKIPLALGDRVRMNEFGLTRHPKYATREGIIVGKVSASSMRVKFDERKQVQTIHHSYLEKVSDREPADAVKQMTVEQP